MYARERKGMEKIVKNFVANNENISFVIVVEKDEELCVPFKPHLMYRSIPTIIMDKKDLLGQGIKIEEDVLTHDGLKIMIKGIGYESFVCVGVFLNGNPNPDKVLGKLSNKIYWSIVDKAPIRWKREPDEKVANRD